MKTLTACEVSLIEDNLFLSARPIVRNRPDFPWHRDGSETITANRFNSSQALAVDFFNSIAELASRDVILDAVMKELEFSFVGPWTIGLEVLVSRDLLGETRHRTQIDAVAKGAAGIVLFECKFTEPDGGGCSQPNPIPSGRYRGVKQCNGSYSEQVNPRFETHSRCALTGKGIRYWEHVPEVLNIDPKIDHARCPFSGGWYQWMRNLVVARALGIRDGIPAAFVIVYADGPFPMAEKVRKNEMVDFINLTEERTVPLHMVSYQKLLSIATKAASKKDKPTLVELGEWMEKKFKKAAKGVKP